MSLEEFINGLRKGASFKGPYPESSEIDHVCILVVDFDSTNKELSCFYMTSESTVVQRMKSRDDEKALVMLESTDVASYFSHPKKTYIQCDATHLLTIKLEQLIMDYQDGLVIPKPNISQEIMSKIHSAISDGMTFGRREQRRLIDNQIK